MSKDIRSFFSVSPKGAQPLRKTNGLNNVKTKPEKSKKKRNIIESDSDDDPEIPVPKKVKKTSNEKKPENVKSEYFAASAADIFGNEPVKRIVKSPVKKSKTSEVEEHDDEEFEAALLQLDTEDIWVEQRAVESPSKKNYISKSKSSPSSTKNSPIKKEKNHENSAKAVDEVEEPAKKKVKAENNDELEEKESILVASKQSSSFPKSTESSKPSSDSKNDGSKTELKKVQPEQSTSSPKSPRSSKASSDSKNAGSKAETKEVQPKQLTSPPKINGLEKSLSVTGSKKSTTETKPSQLKQPSSSPEKYSVKISNEASTVPLNDKLWVEKYKPTSIKQIIGQGGPKSCVQKLLNWLKNWHSNQSGTKKLTRPSPWAKDDDGAYFKAALLSGRPGIGKTTTAHLVCKELGFDVVEFNASDTRSKKLLHQEVGELLSSKSLNPYFSGGNTVTVKHCLVMDEVDGMAGNEDRGGMQELIQLIKTSRVPIICMCNDRSHPKMRSLLNYCFDLSFSRPRIEQLRGAMMSVCFKEKISLSKDVLDNIITNCEQDIRLILNHLSMLAANKKNDVDAIKKHVKLGPWDVLRKVFSAEDHKSMSIHDKSDLFFHDYSICPLFVQENYLNVVPRIPDSAKKSKRMELFAKAAESISLGDLTDKNLRSNNNWSLLPTQAMFASVIPGDILEGYVGRQINFPAWLGKNSRRNKLDRFLQEIQQHTRLRASGSKQAINLDYLVPLRDLILGPLIKNGAEGVSQTIAELQNYDLLKEDLDSILELAQWPDKKDPMTLIESKVKAALTRAYNKIGPACPYAVMAVKKGTKKGSETGSAGLEELGEEGIEEDEEDEEKDDLQSDAMIVVKKPAPKKGQAEKPSTSRVAGGKGGSSRGGRGQNKRGKK